jgi:hypothetical protein
MSAADFYGLGLRRLVKVALEVGMLAERHLLGHAPAPTAADLDEIATRHKAPLELRAVLDCIEREEARRRNDLMEAALARAFESGLPVFEPGGIVALAKTEVALNRAKGQP